MGFSDTGLRGLRATVVVGLAALLTAIGIAVPAVAEVPDGGSASSGINVTSSPGSALVGATQEIPFTAANPSGAELFNAVAVAVLPVGVTYKPGSMSPESYGEPTVESWIPDPTKPTTSNPARAQVLIWSNIADLPAGASLSASFSVTGSADAYPAGASFHVGIGVYANTDVRSLPQVTIPSSGRPVISEASEGGSADAGVAVSPITIQKSETANAESEVYRGEQNPARYELTVSAAPEAGSEHVSVVDYVPAQFKVTGCTGAVDCQRNIVEVDGKVFTELRWAIGSMSAGQQVKVSYAAFVGDQEITLPTGEQNGPSTRPGRDGYTVRNTATLKALYTGTMSGGGDPQVTTSDNADVRVLDLGVVKHADGGTFSGGDTNGYTLTVRTSDYVTSTGVTLTDTVPNGLCPVLPAGVARSGDAWPAECAAAGAGTGTVTGATMTSADFSAATGVFTVKFSLNDLASNEDASIHYSTYMRHQYQDAEPTATGDGFTNTVSVDGTTHESGTPQVVENDSYAKLSTSSVSLTKTVWRNTARTPITGVSGPGNTCAAGDYTSPTGPMPTYQLGDLVCFRLRASFPGGSSTRSPLITDYLPKGMSAVGWAAGPGNTVTVTAQDQPAATATRWALGDAAGATRFVAPGGQLTIDVLARVDSVPQTQPRVTGNLAKMRYSTVDGGVVGLRDSVDMRLSPPPPLTVKKLVDGKHSLSPVVEGQSLGYSIEVTNAGEAAGGNADPVDQVEVWDVLPAGFNCGDITASTPALNTAADCATRPDGATRVRWNLDLSKNPLAGGDKTTISYTLEVPAPLSIASSHTNTAAVVRYTPISTDGITGGAGRATFYPTNPVDAFPTVTKNAPEASDTATIALPAAGVSKSVASTSVTESGNSDLSQATIGEKVTWQYTATVPAKTSIFNGVLTDGLPVGSLLTAGKAPTFTSSLGLTGGEGCIAETAEFRLCTDPANANFGSLFFPRVWTNESPRPVSFTVTLPTEVADVPTNQHGSTITNTAKLTSTATIDDTTPVQRGTAQAQVTVVVPEANLTKSASLGEMGPFVSDDSLRVVGGATVYYQLTARNDAARPPLHDVTLVDCIDNRLLDLTNRTPATIAKLVGGPEAGNGSNGCPAQSTKFTWQLISDLTSSATIDYSVTVPTPISAGAAFHNDATITGTTLPGEGHIERTLTGSDSRTVTASEPTIKKTELTQGSVVPGESVQWRLEVTVPADVELHQARILDTLPATLGTPADAQFTVTCPDTYPGACPTGSRLAADSGAPQVLGIYLDDLATASTTRVFYVDITTKVPTSTSASTTSATNLAKVSWDLTPAATPATAVAGTHSTTDARATAAVRHPMVTTTKAVTAPGTPKAQGEIFTYTVTARSTQNASRNGKPAYNVRVTDRVPTGVIPVVSATDPTPLADGGSLTGGGAWDARARTITWVIPTLRPGDPATSFSYPAKLDLANNLKGAALINTATPTSWDSLATAGKTYTSTTGASASVTPALPKVTTTKKQLTGNPVYIGENVTYSILLTNTGNATATTFSAVDTLPDGWSYIPGSSHLGNTALGDPAQSGKQLTWANLGSLAPGASVTITYQAVAGATVQVGSGVSHTNTARASGVTDATGGTSMNGGQVPYVGPSSDATARINQSDLSISKTAGAFTAGGAGSFTIDVTNHGEDPAIGVMVNDALTLPAGVSVTSTSAPGGTCTTSADILQCSLPSLSSGSSWRITLHLAVAADVAAGTAVPNTATVASRTEDRNLANNSASATATVTTSADLRLTKRATTPASGAVTAGEAIEWSITLTNAGPSVSRGSSGTPILLTDTLPSTITNPKVTGGNPNGCTLKGHDLRCTIGHNLGVGDSIIVTVSGTVPPSQEAGTKAVTNTATVTPVTSDPNQNNNISGTGTDVVVREGLSVRKSITSPAPGTINPGDDITYLVRISNSGPSDARGVFVDDALPVGLTFTGLASGSGWTSTATNGGVRLTPPNGDLAAGQSASVTYTARLDPGFTGQPAELTNVAIVSSTWKKNQGTSSATPDAANPEADLKLTKSVRPKDGTVGDPVIAGEEALYTFTVDNLGPSDAGTITVTDRLPEGMSVTGTLPRECSAPDQVITCVLPSGRAASARPWTFHIGVLVDPDFTGNSLTNSAVVTSVTDDPDTSNNTSSATLDVITRADLTISKDPASAVVLAGDKATWDITVGNLGPSDARNVTVIDTLDPRFELVSATSPDADVTCHGTATVSCAVGTVTTTSPVTVRVVARVHASVPDGTVIDNTAVAHSTTHDVHSGKPSKASDTAAVEVNTVSELSIRKTTSTPVVDAGGTAVFHVAVGNRGPSDAATPVTVRDILPAGMTYVSSSTAGGPSTWACTPTGNNVSCTLMLAGREASLPAASAAPDLQIVAAVDASLPTGTLTNEAQATTPSDVHKPTSSVDVHVTTSADLGITKTSTGTPTAGRSFSWTITATNHGPSDSVGTAAHPIVVNDRLPAGVKFARATTADATCRAKAQDVNCLITHTLKPGDSVTVTLTGQVDPGFSGPVTNTAKVATGVTPEPPTQVHPNTATDTTPPVIEQADLAITKTVDTAAAAIVAGGRITWTLDVRNLGPSNSDARPRTPIVVTDTMPAGVRAVSANGPSKDWTCTVSTDGETVSCALDADLAVGDAQQITVTADIDPGTRGVIENVARVTPGLTAQPTGTTGNDVASARSTVHENADLRLVKDVSQRIVAGGKGRYLLQVFNDGPSTARVVTVTDRLPAGLTFAGVVSAPGTTSPWSCGPAVTDPTAVDCFYAGTVPPGPTPVQLEIEVAAASNMVSDVVNTATVRAGTTDPDLTNNTSTVTGTPVTTADLVVTKTHAPGAQAIAGKAFTWQVTVTNDGPSDSAASASTPIVVNDTLADGTSLAGSGSDDACKADPADPQHVVCAITKPIPAHSSVTLDIVVDIDQAMSGTLTNSATAVSGGTADPDLTNNTGTDALTVTELADLAVKKTVETAADDIVAGRQMSWKVAVSNLGPSDSNASLGKPVRVTDTLPEGVTFVSATGTGWACAPGAESGGRATVDCLHTDSLPVGDAPEITVTGFVGPDVQKAVVNDVVVTPSLTPEPTGSTANNTDTVTSRVHESADLVLTKAVSQTITAGAGGQYVLKVTNLGPSAARDITIVDTLPAGLTFASSSGDGWTCQPGVDTPAAVTCHFPGVLEPAETLTLLINVTADQQLQGDVVNTATVATSTPDPTTDNNTSTATGTVAEKVDLSIVKTAVGSPTVGGTFSYNLSVRNAGPSTARGVLVSDLVPDSLEVLGVSGTGWTCTDTGAIACALPELRSGETAPTITVQVKVLPAAYPGVANTATVSSTTPEPTETLTDNTSTVEVTVPPLSSLRIVKDLSDTLITGKAAHYRITVTNDGPTEDPGPVTISDPMPSGLVANRASLKGAKGSCKVTPTRVDCTVDGLAVGQSATVDLRVYVSAAASGKITNVATATSEIRSVAPVEDDADGTVTVVGLPNAGGGLGLSFGAGIVVVVGAVTVIGTQLKRRKR